MMYHVELKSVTRALIVLASRGSTAGDLWNQIWNYFIDPTLSFGCSTNIDDKETAQLSLTSTTTSTSENTSESQDLPFFET